MRSYLGRIYISKFYLLQKERETHESICGKFGDTTLELDSNTFFKVPKQKNPLEHRYLV